MNLEQCRSAQIFYILMKNAAIKYLVAEIGIDTVENEPSKIIFVNVLIPKILVSEYSICRSFLAALRTVQES